MNEKFAFKMCELLQLKTRRAETLYLVANDIAYSVFVFIFLLSRSLFNAIHVGFYFKFIQLTNFFLSQLRSSSGRWWFSVHVLSSSRPDPDPDRGLYCCSTSTTSGLDECIPRLHFQFAPTSCVIVQSSFACCNSFIVFSKFLDEWPEIG